MYTYLALGDSYTIGENVPPEDNFPNQTVNLLRKQHFVVADPVIIATTGWTTDELAAAIETRSIKKTFSFVTLLIGVNNQYRGLSLDNYKQKFKLLLLQAIAFANGHADNVFVLSLPDWGVTPFAHGRNREKIAKEIDAFNEACKEITVANNCQYIEITESTRGNSLNAEFISGDGLHPTAKEYAIWAKKLSYYIAKTQNFHH